MLLGARNRPGRADVALALVFAGAWAVEAAVRDAGNISRLTMELPGSLLLACLAFRRCRPALTMAVFAAGFCGSSVLGWALGWPSGDAVVPVLALMVATYSVAAHARRAALLPGGLAAILTVVVADLTSAGQTAESLPGAIAFFAVFVVGAPMAAGRLVRARSRLVSMLREQERRLVDQRSAATSAALTAERVRVTARLHEALVSGMQSLVAEVARVQSDDPSGQRDRIAGIEVRARRLLAQTREVVVALASEEAAQRDSSTPGNSEPVRNGPPVAGGVPLEPLGGAIPWTSIVPAVMAVGLLVEVRGRAVGVPMVVALLSCLVLALPLAVVDRHPLPAVGVLWVAAAAFGRFVTPLPGLFAAIGLWFLPPFLVAAFADRRRALAGFVVCCAGAAVGFGAGGLLANLPLMVMSWAAGFVLHERSRLVTELRRTTALLAEGSEQALQHAVLGERARIARDLHDSVGHRLTVLALHASAARRQWGSDPRRARAAVSTIAQVADEALVELRQGFLPSDDGATDQPALSAVPGLVEGARAVGLDVDLRMEGSTAGVAPATQVTAYRVVQEALTNVLRHAPGTPARVDVRCTAAEVVVEVVNGATAGRRNAEADGDSASGHGLLGMAQRVDACGGRLHWGRCPDGSYLVRADFPPVAVTA